MTNTITSGRRSTGPLHHRELVDRQKRVAARLGEIDDLQVLGPDAAQSVGQFDLHALGDQAVHPQVGQHPHTHGLRQLPDGLGERLSTRAGIEALQGAAQRPCQHHVLVGGTLGVRHIWSDVRAEGGLEAQLPQPVQGGQFNRFFVIGGRHWAKCTVEVRGPYTQLRPTDASVTRTGYVCSLQQAAL